MSQIIVPDGYQIKEMSQEEFNPLWQHHGHQIFDENSQMFSFRSHLSTKETEKFDQINIEYNSKPYFLRLGVYFKDEFVGWCIGNQEPAGTFYMRNSAILPEHRKKGLYTALMKIVLQRLTEKGYQRIYSRHNATNNAVIIPKLKAGFIISNFEISDAFGVLVHLSYFTNPLRRKMMEYRVGEVKPDDEIKKALNI